MTKPRFIHAAAAATAAFLSMSTAAAAQDWTVNMMQSTFDNMNYTAMTTVGTSSMCAYEGVCDDAKAGTGRDLDWLEAAELASAEALDPVELRYRRDPAVTAEVEADILAAARRRDPQAAAELEAVFRREDVVASFDQGMRPFGLRADNLPDVFAAYWVLNWAVATGVPGDGSWQPSAEQMQAVRDQIGRAMAYDPAIAAIDQAERQKIAEALIYNFLILDASHTQASAPGREAEFRQLSEVWRRHGEAFFGIDLGALELTDEGFVERG